MSKKSKLSIIGIVTGIIAVLMLFVIPFVGIYFNSDFFNNKQDSIWYFILFLVLTATANITLEKSSRQQIDVDEARDIKLNKILKSK
jgi:hypothetical protein